MSNGLFNFTNKNNVKPSGLPNRWPKPTPEDLRDMPHRLILLGEEQLYSFRNNEVKTSKYEISNFVPKFLLEEFNPRTKIANCYFLMVAALQCIPEISNTGGYPTYLIPLSVVVTVSAISQILEDLARHRADTEANSSTTRRLNRSNGQFETILWANLEVGDLVKMHTREVVPADLLLLAVSERAPESPTGIAYVETKSLDGETNLKIRNTFTPRSTALILLLFRFVSALPSTFTAIKDDTAAINLRGRIEMEHPNKVIDAFSAVLNLHSPANDINTSTPGVAKRGPVLPSNVLLRGCVLRNTDFCWGLVVNTGHDTKIMMSAEQTKAKTSNLEVQASYAVIYIIFLLITFCLAGSIAELLWNRSYHVSEAGAPYLHWTPNEGTEFISHFFYLFLLHASFIPVSLYVTMSIVRFAQSYFKVADLDMYYAKTDTPALVRTMTLNEECGQISHIFSDKTGTLTCNVMDFRKMSISGVPYDNQVMAYVSGEGVTEIGRAAWKVQGMSVPEEALAGERLARLNGRPHVCFYSGRLLSDLTSTGGAGGDPRQAEKIRTFCRALSLCHDVIAEHSAGRDGSGQDSIRLSASNPDDEALVEAAAYFGYKFADRVDKIVTLKVSNPPPCAFAVTQLPTGDGVFDLEGESAEPGVQLLKTGMGAGRATATNPVEYDERLEILETIEFTSKRKRMSVLFRDVDGRLRLMMKGADSVIFERARPYTRVVLRPGDVGYPNHLSRASVPRPEMHGREQGDSLEDPLVDDGTGTGTLCDVLTLTERHVEQYSSEGLRCLVLAESRPDEQACALWREKYRAAKADIKQIEQKKLGLPNTIESLEDELEQGLCVLGVTAIEDKLQEGVPDTIATLMKAGLKIWMLTGDKEETAINIAVACNLLLPSPHMRRVVINRGSAATAQLLHTTFDKEIQHLSLQEETYESHTSASTFASIHRALSICLGIVSGRVRSTGSTGVMESSSRTLAPTALVIDGASLLSVMADDSSFSNATLRPCDPVTGNPLSIDMPVHSDDLAFINNTSAPRSISDQIGNITRRLRPNYTEVSRTFSSLQSSSIDSVSDRQSSSSPMSLREKLLLLARSCAAVVACRVSPDQKREMVRLIKQGVRGVRTLAIGDGANDVAMIQEAHIGVGIKGEEGVQAVNAADYALAQFRFLAPLLLKHGRYNYIRMSFVVCFIFYKNIMCSLCQFWFNTVNGFSGQKYFTEGAIQTFNLIYTSVPIILYGAYDTDLPPSYPLITYPQLYKRCINNGYFNSVILWSWLLSAIMESILLSVLPLYYIQHSDPSDTGSSHWAAGALCYTAVIAIVNLKLFMFQTRWYWLSVVILFLSFVSWIGAAYCISALLIADYNFFYMWNREAATGSFWLALLLLVSMVIVKDIFYAGVRREVLYTPEDVLQEMHADDTQQHARLAEKDSTARVESMGGTRATSAVVLEQFNPTAGERASRVQNGGVRHSVRASAAVKFEDQYGVNGCGDAYGVPGTRSSGFYEEPSP